MQISELQPAEKLSKDILLAAKTLTDDEARFLVDAYYIMQEDRKRSYNQERALGESSEPNSIITWLAGQSETLEGQIKKALDKYTQQHPMGEWMREVIGIGPVISAGLLAYLGMTHWKCRNEKAKNKCSSEPCTALCGIVKIETVGHWWRFAGLDPSVKWENGQRRPWNATLKTLCWKLGQSFMKISGNPNAFYGQLYRQRKEYEVTRNESGQNSEAAAAGLQRVSKSTESYKHYASGKLPPAQVDARARRWVIKIFLSHLHEAWYKHEFLCAPPKPFAIAVLGHAHMIQSSH